MNGDRGNLCIASGTAAKVRYGQCAMKVVTKKRLAPSARPWRNRRTYFAMRPIPTETSRQQTQLFNVWDKQCRYRTGCGSAMRVSLEGRGVIANPLCAAACRARKS
ncbi:hypothetical protein KCP75_16235 [Salmonella enterica subsp. enterica]|nr:hypothetical protein KCP75_16235 [Salmonella enterica subsp. enterica]